MGRFHQRFFAHVFRGVFHTNVFFSSYVLHCARKTRAKNIVEIDPMWKSDIGVNLLEVWHQTFKPSYDWTNGLVNGLWER
jgi:hypothetical protein